MFNEVYKQVAWNVFTDNYSKNLQTHTIAYFRILNKYGKIALGANYEVLLDSNDAQNSMRNFATHSGEFTKYLQAISKNVLDTANSGVFDSNCFVMFNERLKELDASLSNNPFGLNGKAFDDRTVEYWNCENSDMKVGFSLPNDVKPTTDRERLAAMFADVVVAYNIVSDFIEYQQIKEIYKTYSNQQYAIDIYKFALEIYDIVKKQSEPYVTGKIIEIRKSKGLCPDCGGTYKGLFKKKCSVCGAEKR